MYQSPVLQHSQRSMAVFSGARLLQRASRAIPAARGAMVVQAKAATADATVPLKTAASKKNKHDIAGKADLAHKLAPAFGSLLNKAGEPLPVSKAESIVEEVLKAITASVSNGGVVQLTGFGKFEPRKRTARKGRNPKTGAELDIAETVVPGFTAGKAFKDAVKNGKVTASTSAANES